MKLSKIYIKTTEEVVVHFDNYIPFPEGSWSRFQMLYAIIKKTTTDSGTKYSWEGRCQAGMFDTMSVTDNSPVFKDIDFPPIREAFDKLGWRYPENPHNGKPDYP